MRVRRGLGVILLFILPVENGGSKQADRNGIKHKSNANAATTASAEAELPRLTGTKSQVRFLKVSKVFLRFLKIFWSNIL